MSVSASPAAAAGLLPYALIWSKIGLGLSMFAGVAIGTADLSAVATHESVVAHQVHGTLLVAVALLFLGSLIVECVGRMIRNQRRIIARLDRLDLGPDDGGGPARLRLVSSQDIPPDKVRAFELGRRVERDLHHDTGA